MMVTFEPDRMPIALTLRCVYCRRLIPGRMDLAAAIASHEARCQARPILQRLWADDYARAQRLEELNLHLQNATSGKAAR